MAAPTHNTPIPPAIRPIVDAVHRRYVAACHRNERPAIDGPRVAVGLLTMNKCVILAQCGYYPIPPGVIRLGMTPAEHQKREIFDTVAEQLPDAFAAVLEIVKA